MTNVQVQCCHCKGRGWMEDYRVVNGVVVDHPWPTDPFSPVTCPTCLGFGVVVATELKAVVSWVRVEPRH